MLKPGSFVGLVSPHEISYTYFCIYHNISYILAHDVNKPSSTKLKSI
jgi:hypothetical protein